MTKRVTVTRPLLVSVALVLGLSACSLQKKESKEIALRSITPSSGLSYAPRKVYIKGENLGVFEEKKDGKETDYHLEMWTGSSERLGRGFSLESPSLVGPKTLTAVVPPGVYPGSYKLVIRQGRRMSFTQISYLVRTQKENRDAPTLTRISPDTIRAGEPRRLAFIGANIIDTVHVALEGPMPEKNSPLLRLKRKGFNLGWPLQDVRLRKLNAVRNDNAARVSAAVPENLPAGRYTVRISTTSHKGHPLNIDTMLTVRPGKTGVPARILNYIIFFGVLGTIFLLGMIMAWRQGDVGLESRESRLNLLWMLGGLVFYAVLIGGIQFYLSRLF